MVECQMKPLQEKIIKDKKVEAFNKTMASIGVGWNIWKCSPNEKRNLKTPAYKLRFLMLRWPNLSEALDMRLPWCGCQRRDAYLPCQTSGMKGASGTTAGPVQYRPSEAQRKQEGWKGAKGTVRIKAVHAQKPNDPCLQFMEMQGRTNVTRFHQVISDPKVAKFLRNDEMAKTVYDWAANGHTEPEYDMEVENPLDVFAARAKKDTKRDEEDDDDPDYDYDLDYEAQSDDEDDNYDDEEEEDGTWLSDYDDEESSVDLTGTADVTGTTDVPEGPVQKSQRT
eukprot:jgi/Mesvir1/2023/Mv06785-RA.1